MKILVIYFDVFVKSLEKRFIENNIKAKFLKYGLETEKYIKDHINKIDVVVIGGSIKRILRENDFPMLNLLMKKPVTIIGICFGFEYLALKSGGKIKEGNKHFENEILNYNDKKYTLYYNHYDRVIQLPKQWNIILRKSNYITMASTDKWIGFQFHPEKYKKSFELFMLPLLK